LSFHAPKEFIVVHPVLGLGEGNNGFFQFFRDGIHIYCMASDGGGWEHVSVSVSKKRCPTWEEMSFIKDYFWDSEDCVVQFHPPKAEYVNDHKFCLHLWRPIGIIIQTPPPIFVGRK
jgi:hypothetical protein